MKPRDVVLVAAVVVLLGFAAYDAVRDGSGGAEQPTAATASTTTPTEPVATTAPRALPRRVLSGTLLYVDVL